MLYRQPMNMDLKEGTEKYEFTFNTKMHFYVV